MQINTNDLTLNRKLALYFAGPFTNILIVLISYLYSANDIAWINIFLSLINLLPVVPLDGGNVLKAVLWKYMKKTYVHRIILIINAFFLVLSAYCFFESHSYYYFAILFMALKGIFYERNNILEERIKNSYKKYL